MRRGRLVPRLIRYTPALPPTTRSSVWPVANDGSAAVPTRANDLYFTRLARRRAAFFMRLSFQALTLFLKRTCRRPPVTKATCEQSIETLTAVVGTLPWRPRGSDTRCRERPGPRDRNASVTPLVSPRTRLLAFERNAMHFG